MRAIWGICIGAALAVAGFVASTYAIEPEHLNVAGQLLLFLDLGVAVMVFAAAPVCLKQAERGALAAHWLAWRRHVPGSAIWVSAAMVVAGLAFSLLYLHLTLPIHEDHGRYWLSISEFHRAPASREEYLASFAQATRLVGAVAVLMLGVASVAFGVLLSRPGGGTSRTTGRP